MPHLEHPPESPTRPPKHFECDIQPGGRSAAWVSAHGELDLASAPQLKQTLVDALGAMRLVALDLRELTFMDSTGVHLVGLAQRLEIIDLKPGVAPSQVVAALEPGTPSDGQPA